MFQNTKNILIDTLNTLFYETFSETFMKHHETFSSFKETAMFQFCFKRKSGNPLNLLTQLY